MWSFIASWDVVRVLVGFLDRHSGTITALATVAIVVLTCFYVRYSKRQWETMRDTLEVGQRACVTIGRKDGVVAEFVMPKDPKDNAGLVIYFQNSGHMPAEFNWGPLSTALIPPLPPTQSNPLTFGGRRFVPITRTRNRKGTGEGVTKSAGSTIAADSLYVADAGELLQAATNDLLHTNQMLMVIGAFEYCDGFGNYSCKRFDLAYQGVPFSAWRLLGVTECPPALHAVQNPRPDLEYLPPCKTLAESQKRDGK